MALPDTSFAAGSSVVAVPRRSVRRRAGAHRESRSQRGYLAGGFGVESSLVYCRAFTRGDW